MNSIYKPQFLNKGEILIFFLKTLILQGYKNRRIRKAFSVKNLIISLWVQKKLLLTKFIKFNGHYYSTLYTPHFPSSAFENMLKNGGMNFNAAGTDLKQQIDTALLAITSNCNLNCIHCYEKQNINSNNKIPVNKWIDIVKQLQTKGVSIIILTGGEPLIAFNDLIKILDEGDKSLSDFHIHTSGYSVTKDKVKALKQAGLTAAGIGLDDFRPERHNKIRGNNSFEQAIKALRLFNEEGILTYVNFCAHEEIINSNELFKYYDFVKSLNVSLIELLEPKPCGGYINKNPDDLINEKEKEKLYEFTLTGNTKKQYKNYPLIYYLAHIEGKNQMGCMMGGLSHFYIDSAGNVNPCVFMPVSFGNIMKEDFNSIYKRMRSAIPFPIHTGCPSVMLSNTIKNKKNLGVPVPFNAISNEWHKILIKEG